MMTMYLGLSGVLLVIRRVSGQWITERHLEGKMVECLAADPLRPERVYCGANGQGLWCSDDAGSSWQPVGAGIPHTAITAVSVSGIERYGGYGAVYAGTEPTTLFRSEDGGATWQDRSSLTDLPSASSWSFPPKPWTHHTRWIELDPANPGQLWVCVEAGALVRSDDAGQTWVDRTPDGPYDTHTLRTHPQAPGRLYSAAGDGFMWPGKGYSESRDGGKTWVRIGEGLEHHYLYGLAVDSGDPDTMVVSAASSPQHAHNPRAAESAVYRRSGGGMWQVTHPTTDQAGALIYALASSATEPGIFYALNNLGLFRSPDAALSWERVPIEWPENVGRGTCVEVVRHA
jgi:photosystem II stability/assembly factor-like uncharacterized protein